MSNYRTFVEIPASGATTVLFDNRVIYLNSSLAVSVDGGATSLAIEYISANGTEVGATDSTLIIADGVAKNLENTPHRGLKITPTGATTPITLDIVAWGGWGRY